MHWFRRSVSARVLIWGVCFFWLTATAAPSAAAPSVPGFYGKFALPDIAANALPQVLSPSDPNYNVDGATVGTATNNKLEILQNQQNAIIHWDTFNIGKDAWVHFNQQGNTDWTALNRIFDINPSQIYGRLTADGQIYLLNQNGMLFGPSARVNVHGLVASSLNYQVDDDLFLENRHDTSKLAFLAEDFNGRGDNTLYDADEDLPGPVANHGSIATDNLGSVFLLAPRVENSGTIVTPAGQAALVSGTDIDLSLSSVVSTTATRSIDINVHADADLTFAGDDTGEFETGLTINYAGAGIIADTGLAQLYGRKVEQDGLVRAVTAVKRSGRIQLVATERITAGEESQTICPLSDSDEAVHTSFPFEGGKIILAGARDLTAAGIVEHRGLLWAPAGTISIYGDQRVYLADGSITDVAGAWLYLDMSELAVSFQLNSNELRDAYRVKDGILKGETIRISTLSGSSIGDASDYLTVEELTAIERGATGGDILIKALGGDIIVDEGAIIDISGGGVTYGEGYLSTTKLLYEDSLYDIASAPEDVAYQGLAGYSEKSYDRYGIVETYDGIYFGGIAPVLDRWSGFSEGKDAGTLTLIAPYVVLNGTLDGSTVQGPYQTETEEEVNDSGETAVVGNQIPEGGTLVLGRLPLAGETDPDMSLQSLHIAATAPVISTDFDVETDLGLNGDKVSVIAAETLNQAGLSNIDIYANREVVIESGASITLNPGDWRGDWTGALGFAAGRLQVQSGHIEAMGTVSVSGGTVDLTVRDTAAKLSVSESLIAILPGAVIDVGGEVKDFSGIDDDDGKVLAFGQTDGGRIRLANADAGGSGVFVYDGSRLDVSGGYIIDPDGNVEAGDAGRIEMEGGTLLLEGDLSGYAVAGNNGGEIMLHADSVNVVSQASESLLDGVAVTDIVAGLPADRKGSLKIAPDQLVDGGFTRIDLRSVRDLAVDAGVTLAPSDLRRYLAGSDSTVINYTGTSLVRRNGELFALVDPLEAGETAIRLSAGVDRSGIEDEDNETDARLTIDSGALIRTAPRGSVAVTAPDLMVGGDIIARGGDILLKSTAKDLRIAQGVTVTARGFLQLLPDDDANDPLPTYEAVNGGEISLGSSLGKVILEAGSRIDVSGGEAAESFILDSGGAPSSTVLAGSGGSIEIIGQKTPDLSGTLIGGAASPGNGGSLTIEKTHLDESLELNAAMLSQFADAGFDSLTLRSARGLVLDGGTDATFSRKVVLDAPEIRGSGSDVLSLAAPWVVLANTRSVYLDATDYDDILDAADDGGDGRLQLDAEWIDVEGSIALTGFDTVGLSAEEDIRLMAEDYTLGSGESPDYLQEGVLASSGDLTLRAARIYPTTASRFSIRVNGNLTTLAAGASVDDPVYSAGGAVYIEADSFDHAGVLAAPLGTIDIAVDGGEILLREGSRLTTDLEIPVRYGNVESYTWTVEDPTAVPGADGLPLEALPEGLISLTGETISLADGAAIDASGGGLLFTYLFESSGTKGTYNPLERSGSYVIVPDGSVRLPGEGVYLTGGAGIEEGLYTLLPAEFAFLPGAVVAVDLAEAGIDYTPGQKYTDEGYRILNGKRTNVASGQQQTEVAGFAVRSAQEVLDEGYFTVFEGMAGAAGSIDITGTAAIALDGDLILDSLDHYRGGRLALATERITLTQGEGDHASGLVLDPDFLTALALDDLQLGDGSLTTAIEFQDGTLKARTVEMEAQDRVHLGQGASLFAEDDAVFLEHLIYSYAYDPDIGLDIIHPVGLTALDGESEWIGNFAWRTGTGIVLQTLLVEDGEVVQTLYNGSYSAPSGLEQPVFSGAGIADPGGTARLAVTHSQILLESGSSVHGSREVLLDGQIQIESGAELTSDGGLIELSSSDIYFVPRSYAAIENIPGLYITNELWGSLATFGDISLVSAGDLLFVGDYDLSVTGGLVLDAQRIAAIEPAALADDYSAEDGQVFDGAATVSISAASLTLGHSLGDGAAYDGPAEVSLYTPAGVLEKHLLEDAGQLVLTASDTIATSDGNLTLDGFTTIDISSQGDFIAYGEGSLTSDLDDPVAGTMSLTAARMAAGLQVEEEDGEAEYRMADYRIDAADGKFQVLGNGETAGDTLSLGGHLSLSGGEIVIGRKDGASTARLETPSGWLTLSAARDLYVGSGTQILAPATGYGPGGNIELSSATGNLTVADGALVDVSATESAGTWDAGRLVLSAPEGIVTLDGDFEAGALDGTLAGRVSVDTLRLDQDLAGNEYNMLSGLLTALAAFDGGMEIRARQGDVVLADFRKDGVTGYNADGDAEVMAEVFRLSADTGAVTIAGQIDASGETGGGDIEIYAGGDYLGLLSGSRLVADGTAAGAGGGQVTLAVDDAAQHDGYLWGFIYQRNGAVIDVSGYDAEAAGGQVVYRAPRVDAAQVGGSHDEDAYAFLFGTVVGAQRVRLEAGEIYTAENSSYVSGNAIANLSALKSETAAWMSANGDGVETRITRDLTLASKNLFSDADWSALTATEAAAAVEIAPAIEIRHSGNLSLGSTWNLSDWRYDDIAGSLTIRATGDLAINADLVDHHTAIDDLYAVSPGDSWRITLAAGADLTGVDPLAVSAPGNLTVAANKVVYTESSALRFAAGGNVELGDARAPNYMINSDLSYSLGTYSGEVQGRVDGNFILQSSAAVQSATGDIGLRVDGDMVMYATDASTAIRTTGHNSDSSLMDFAGFGEYLSEQSLFKFHYNTVVSKIGYWPDSIDVILDWNEPFPNNIASFTKTAIASEWTQMEGQPAPPNRDAYWKYADGGDIRLEVGGSLKAQGASAYSNQGWNYGYKDKDGELVFTASYTHESGSFPTTPAGGIVALAGGDVNVRVGGDAALKAGTFGTGDLSVAAGGNLDGRFLVVEGDGNLSAFGSFGTVQPGLNTMELFDAQMAVFAQGDAYLSGIANPLTDQTSQFASTTHFRVGYTTDASLAAGTALGDILLTGNGYLPANLDLSAGRDLRIQGDFTLIPSRTATLRLSAQRDIDGTYSKGGNVEHGYLVMSDMAPEAILEQFYLPRYAIRDEDGKITEIVEYHVDKIAAGTFTTHGFPADENNEDHNYQLIFQEMMARETNLGPDDEVLLSDAELAYFESLRDRIDQPMHAAGNEASAATVEISAGRDLSGMDLYLSSAATLTAGENIQDIYLQGQNNDIADTTLVQAGRNLTFSEGTSGLYKVGIKQAGPGNLIVQAGNRIDLGDSQTGIRTTGAAENATLGSTGCNITLISGYSGLFDTATTLAFFDALKTANEALSTLQAGGEAYSLITDLVQDTHTDLIDPFLGESPSGSGDIDMVSSQVAADADESSIYIIANGDLNVGRSVFFEDENQVANTGIYTAAGGEIGIYSVGDINVNESRIMTFFGGDIAVWSDQGSINAGKGSRTAINQSPPKVEYQNGVPVLVFQPPTSGSGIRAVTYDPDGAEGPRTAPEPGWIYLSAPEGIIDAGEAGISGGRVFLTATEIVNSANIEAAGGVVGGPMTGESGVNIGALSGIGDMADTKRIAEEAAMGESKKNLAENNASLAAGIVPWWLDVKVVSFDTAASRDENNDR